MALLINNAAGVISNTNSDNPIVLNKDPVFVSNNLLTTIYAWATDWDTAQVQIYVCPTRPSSPLSAVWFPVGSPFTANGFYTFQHRWFQIKAVVSGATSDTVGLYCTVFDGL